MQNYIIMTICVNDILSCCHTGYNSHDAIAIVFLIGYHIFCTLLPGCYYEMILLDVHLPNHHI